MSCITLSYFLLDSTFNKRINKGMELLEYLLVFDIGSIYVFPLRVLDSDLCGNKYEYFLSIDIFLANEYVSLKWRSLKIIKDKLFSASEYSL